MAYLLISRPGLVLRRTRWLTDAHLQAARAGRLVVVDMQHQLRLDARGWREIPPRRGEPRVLLVEEPDEDDLLDDFFL
jgi:hypothetical protein